MIHHKSVYAAIDIGTNTFRFLIAQPQKEACDQPWQTVCYRQHVVRLGEGLHGSGLLCEAAMQRGLVAFMDFRQLLDDYQVPLTAVRAVSTSAMRSATNSEDFIHRVQQSTGINIAVISGEEEAATALLGSCAVLEHRFRENMLLFDVGGGSTEFVRAKNGIADDAISRPLGVVRLVDAWLRSDPPCAEDYQAMMDASMEHIKIVTKAWSDHTAPPTLVGIAGTITTLAATMLNMHPYKASTINNTVVTKHQFFALRDHLLGLNHHQRENIPAIESGRADLIIAGCAIVEAVFTYWNYEQMVVVDAGLLEGVWMQGALS